MQLRDEDPIFSIDVVHVAGDEHLRNAAAIGGAFGLAWSQTCSRCGATIAVQRPAYARGIAVAVPQRDPAASWATTRPPTCTPVRSLEPAA